MDTKYIPNGYKACIVGHVATGKVFRDGQTIKTRNIKDVLEREFGVDRIVCVDTYGGIRAIFGILFRMLKYAKKSDNIIILPASNGIRVILPLCSLLKRLYNIRVLYVVIGGWLPQLVKGNAFISKMVKTLDAVYVETHNMKEILDASGYSNVVILPNFKNTTPLDESKLIYSNGSYRLCTFSRVMKEKGIEIAVDAVKELNYKEDDPCFYLDIYGTVPEEQKEWFSSLNNSFPDYIRYMGEVDSDKSIDVLKQYHALLFPTYYDGEGFAGTIVDGLFSGVPIIASDWKYNSEVITNMKTGIILGKNNSSSLADAIKKSCDNELWKRMKLNCLKEAQKYTGTNAIAVLAEGMQ